MTNAMNLLLKKAAKKADIKKNVYCHLLKHSQATGLANTMTEQQLKKQMKWAGSSNMAQTYVHFSNPEIDNAVLASYSMFMLMMPMFMFMPMMSMMPMMPMFMFMPMFFRQDLIKIPA